MHLLKLPIHATPGAKRTEAAGEHGGALRVRLGAPPVDGKANAALIAWAARAFGVPKTQVELLHGASGRQKLLQLRFGSAVERDAAQAQVDAWMAAGDGAQ
ncbi:DUF167 domain-containing protein [Ottowia sp.]|uniref:DUF167 domain-containing protein n=1 Tax=Ottowia sp. TaxID=1898956 RepID=UPI002BA8D4DA|nr:DUF167 domain-containing protein [Ottowia sp.]HRN77078.1 DUF167 domain-containing protein [Ottowia sp.]HRQ04124.1 DUF167 domain-containing protein [Ottowia sp.]